MRTATDQYQQGEDQIARFIADRCVIAQGLEVKSSALSTAYGLWCEENGESALKGRNFTDEVGGKFDSYHKNTGSHYMGLGLRDAPANPRCGSCVNFSSNGVCERTHGGRCPKLPSDGADCPAFERVTH